MTATTPLLFAPESSRPFGQRVADRMGLSLSPSEEREFENGEHKMRPLVAVRNRDVYVLALLCGDAQGTSNDKLCRLLFFIGALKDAGAARVTVCAPYLPYARKDRRTKADDPITTRYVAALFEAVGTDQVLAMEVHNVAAFENAFRIPVASLDSAALFATHFAGESSDWVIASPDVGGVKRAQHLRDVFAVGNARAVGSAFMDKKRSAGVVSGDTLVGDVAGKRVLIVDDLISSGTTMLRAVAACRRAGATHVHLAATHAVLQPKANGLFAGASKPDSVVVTNSVALPAEFQAFVGQGLTVLDIAPLYAQAVAQAHAGESLAGLCGLE